MEALDLYVLRRNIRVMAYIECPRCHQRALSVATTCPRCGHDFTDQRVRHSGQHPVPPDNAKRQQRVIAIVASLTLLLLFIALQSAGRGVRSGQERKDDLSGMASPAVAAADSTAPDTVVVEAPAPAPAGQAEETAAAAVATAPPKAAPKPPEPTRRKPAPIPLATSARIDAPPPGPGEARYAVTWVNVRDGRSINAAVVRVLNPGELVRVRDYEGGWWQAILDGKPIGYVGNSVLQRQPLGAHDDREPSTDGR